MSHDTFIISKYSGKYLLSIFALFFLAILIDLDFIALLSFIIGLVVLYIFRNQEREILTYEHNIILSPVDGKVNSIEQKDGKTVITIKSGCLDSSILRTPVTAKVANVDKVYGARLSSNELLSSKLNEQVTLSYVTQEGDTIVTIKHLLTQSFADLFCTLQENSESLIGSRYGLLVKGITTIEIDSKLQSSIVVGSRVHAGLTQLSEF